MVLILPLSTFFLDFRSCVDNSAPPHANGEAGPMQALSQRDGGTGAEWLREHVLEVTSRPLVPAQPVPLGYWPCHRHH